MSDREQIAEVAHDKWATVSDSLRSLMTNEQFAQKCILKKTKILFFFVCFVYFFILKMSNLLIPSFLVSDVSKSLRLLTKNERCEPIAQVAHQKWAIMSDLLRSFRGNEWSGANRSGRSPKMSDCEQIAQLAQKNLQSWADRWSRSEEMSDHEQIAQVAHHNWANERIAQFF